MLKPLRQMRALVCFRSGALTVVGVLVEIAVDRGGKLLLAHRADLLLGVNANGRARERSAAELFGGCPHRACEISTREAVGHQSAARSLDELNGGGMDGAGHAVPGPHALREHTNALPLFGFAENIHHRGRRNRSLVANDGGEGEFQKWVGDPPTGDVLTCHEIHLTLEAHCHKDRIVVGGVVGENDVVFGQIFCLLEAVSEFQLEKQANGMVKQTVKETVPTVQGRASFLGNSISIRLSYHKTREKSTFFIKFIDKSTNRS